MKKVRTVINVALGSLIAMLGMSSCAEPMVKYGIPDDILGKDTALVDADTTVRCMYGVPTPNYQLPVQQDDNEIVND